MVLSRLQSTADKEAAETLFGEDVIGLDAHTLKGRLEFQSAIADLFLVDLLEKFPSAVINAKELVQNARTLIPRFVPHISTFEADKEDRRDRI